MEYILRSFKIKGPILLVESNGVRSKKNSSLLNGQSDDVDKFCKRFVFHFRGRIRFLIDPKTRRLAGNEF